jgi:hypothetical protein
MYLAIKNMQCNLLHVMYEICHKLCPTWSVGYLFVLECLWVFYLLGIAIRQWSRHTRRWMWNFGVQRQWLWTFISSGMWSRKVWSSEISDTPAFEDAGRFFWSLCKFLPDYTRCHIPDDSGPNLQTEVNRILHGQGKQYVPAYCHDTCGYGVSRTCSSVTRNLKGKFLLDDLQCLND